MVPSAQGDEIRRQSVALLRANPYGMLVTVSDAGAPHARLVQHLAVDDDAALWIGTSPRSRKVVDIAANPRVTYTVEDRTRFAYAALSGTAALLADEASRQTYWREELRAFFPGGPAGGDFVVIKISSVRAELVDFAGAVHPDPFGLAPAVAAHNGDGWQLEQAYRSAAS
jgi:general stress protein 26